MRASVALSEHPVPATAVGEVAGQVIDRLGTDPDVVMVFVTPPFAGALEDVAAALEAILRPAVLVGAASEIVLGRDRFTSGPAVSLWAASVGSVAPVRLGACGWALPAPDFPMSALVLVADPFSVDLTEVVAGTPTPLGATPVVGGTTSGVKGPGGSRLVLAGSAVGDHRIHDDGAVGVAFGPGARAQLVQGTRPVGRPWVVTAAVGRVVLELGGRSAFSRLVDLVRLELGPEDQLEARRGPLLLGRLVDEHRDRYLPQDFVVRPLVGADRRAGGLALDEEVHVGTTVQFHLPDADVPEHQLERLFAASPHVSGLAFFAAPSGRGRRSGVNLATGRSGPPALAGMSTGTQIGPVAGGTFRHERASVFALWDAARDGSERRATTC